MPRLLHLADVHLGARHDDLGAAAAQQRERQLAAFVRAIDLGLERRVDVALICGDLFDSNAQPRRSVERAVTELSRLTSVGIRVVIIPGTHDAYDSRSIYRAFDLARMAGLAPGTDLLTVLTPDRPELLLADLDLAVFARVFATKRAPRSPLEGFAVANDGRASWTVGMIHGSLLIPGRTDSDDVVFTEAEIAASGLDYLALGHWHSFVSGRSGDTSWAYAGAPEPVAVDQDGAGFACIVELGDDVGGGSSVAIEQVRVGRTGFRTETVDIAGVASQDALIERLRALADPDLVLHISIEGVAAETMQLDPLEIEQRLAPSFLHVRVRDRSVADLAPMPDLSPDTVAGAFIADIGGRLRAAEEAGDEAAVAQARAVLRLGRRLLLDDPDHVSLP